MSTSSQTNIASLDSMLADLVSFSVANAGFTDEGTDLSGTEPLYRISKTVDGQLMYWGFREAFLERTGNGYGKYRVEFGMKLILPTDANFSANASGPSFLTIMGAYDFPGPYTKYTFNTEGTCVFAVLECSSGIYTHLSFGNLTKCGTFTGGAFTTACNQYYRSGEWSPLTGGSGTVPDSPNIFSARNSNYAGVSASVGAGYVHFSKGFNDRQDFPAFNAKKDLAYSGARGVSGTMGPNQDSTASTSGYSTSSLGFYLNPNARMAYDASLSPSTFRAPIFPIQIYRQSDDDYRNVQLLGSIPNIGNIRLLNLNPEETVNTDWVVYPFSQKNGDNVSASDSGTWGVAYKVVP